MAEIRNFWLIRHLRSEPSFYVLSYRRGELRAHGRGLALWYLPMSASIAEIPVDDRELTFMIHGRSNDFQDVTVQGVITYRVADPHRVAERIDFSVDLETGEHQKQPLEKLSLSFTSLAQEVALEYVAGNHVRDIVARGVAELRERLARDLVGHAGLLEAGLEVVAVHVAAVQPTAELERALEAPTREKIQQAADDATFERRARAVEKERAIAENELQNRIELARREEDLIAQAGHNERRRVEEDAASKKLDAEGKADRTRIQTAAEAESIRAIGNARLESERERMDVYRTMPTPVLMGLAAQELAKKLHTIEHLSLTPELLGPMLQNLVRAGTNRLEAPRSE